MALIILASPHADGLTDAVGRAFAAGLGIECANVEILATRDFHVVPCTGCQICARPPFLCPLEENDQAGEILGSILKADLLAVAAPIYFYSLPAHFKALIDRSQPFWFRENISVPMRPLIALMSAGRSNGDLLFAGALRTLSWFAKPFHFRLRDSLLLRGSDGALHMDALEARARKLGRRWGAMLAGKAYA